MNAPSKLPSIRWIPDPNRDKLRRWFTIRSADLLLREEPAVADDPASAAPASVSSGAAPSGPGSFVPISGFDHDVKVGEVRLLSPDLTPGSNRPVYVAVFREWDDDLVLIAPFSPYSIAATRSELEFPQRRHALRVLCLWNARTVHPVAISESWLVDRLAEEERNDAWAVFRHAATGEALPDALLSRVGARLVRPDDPRVAYQDEETELLNYLSGISMQVEEEERDSPVPETEIPPVELDFGWFDSPAALAAKSSESDQTQVFRFIAPGLQLELALYLSNDGRRAALAVYEPDETLSHRLDHAAVFFPETRRVATIHQGMAEWENDVSKGGLKILAANGSTVALVPQDGNTG